MSTVYLPVMVSVRQPGIDSRKQGEERLVSSDDERG